MTTAGKLAQWYFADPELRSAGATASIITCFSSEVRSRWPADGNGASPVPVVVHAESAKPTDRAIKLKFDICRINSAKLVAIRRACAYNLLRLCDCAN